MNIQRKDTSDWPLMRRMATVLVGLGALLVFAAALGLLVGPSALSTAEVWDAVCEAGRLALADTDHHVAGLAIAAQSCIRSANCFVIGFTNEWHALNGFDAQIGQIPSGALRSCMLRRY